MRHRSPGRSLFTPVGLLLLGLFFLPPSLQAQGAEAVRRSHSAAEDSLYQVASERAWRYVVRETHEETGLANSVRGYPYATLWDISSNLLAIHSAGELGLIGPEETKSRLAKALGTLARLPLFDQATFNKVYEIRQARATRSDGHTLSTSGGSGWSAIDTGRFLIALRILKNHHPDLQEDLEAVARRLDLTRFIREERLRGGRRTSAGTVDDYPEGQIGYEQYAAAGFALWGQNVDRTLDIRRYGKPMQVMGVEVLTDTRGYARLTSDPFVLMGLELGWWRPEWRQQAEQVLEAQEARFRQTGQLTVVGEDALPIPPHHFYYYSLVDGERPFTVTTRSSRNPTPAPRWLSTKVAFGWHAIFPGPYTGEALWKVASGARADQNDWAAGVFEETLKSTGGSNLNTSAVILEAALYRKRGRPLMAKEGE